MNASDRIICAIDTSDLEEALLLAELLSGEVGALKLGKEFFTAHGPGGLDRIAERNHRIFLDLKFHDIPNTVAGAVRAAAALGCSMLTVHASGGGAMLEAAVDAAAGAGPDAPRIFAVTVLTSLDDRDLATVGQSAPAADQVMRLARLAESAGLDGAVCSPREAAMLRSALPAKFELVAPGVRPLWDDGGDQKRVATPGEAVAAGADMLVVGRPITRSGDPAGAARRIAGEIAEALAR